MGTLTVGQLSEAELLKVINAELADAQVLPSPRVNPSSQGSGVVAGIAKPTTTALGWAPMAAMSARFWAAARAPICSALDQLVRKWWPCTKTSVDTQ